MVSAYDFICTVIGIILSISIVSFIVNSYLMATEDFSERKRFIGLFISAAFSIISLGFLLGSTTGESINLLIGRAEIASVSYKPGDREVLFVHDGKTFQLASNKCRFVVTNKNQISDYALPYYEWVQEESINAVTILGRKFYDDPRIEIKYTFYVTEDFLENLDYEIEHTILADG